MKKRILVVDDEAGLTRMLKLALEQTGEYVVQMANNAQTVIMEAEQYQPDLVLMDVMMPGIDGGELALQLKARPALAKVPVVFLTAAVRKKEVLERGGLIGGLPFLAKPIKVSEVLGCLRQHLGPE